MTAEDISWLSGRKSHGGSYVRNITSGKILSSWTIKVAVSVCAWFSRTRLFCGVQESGFRNRTLESRMNVIEW